MRYGMTIGAESGARRRIRPAILRLRLLRALPDGMWNETAFS